MPVPMEVPTAFRERFTFSIGVAESAISLSAHFLVVVCVRWCAPKTGKVDPSVFYPDLILLIKIKIKLFVRSSIN